MHKSTAPQPHPESTPVGRKVRLPSRMPFGSVLSFFIHAAIVGVLWSAPTIPVTPEPPPPESIDATLLPPPTPTPAQVNTTPNSAPAPAPTPAPAASANPAASTPTPNNAAAGDNPMPSPQTSSQGVGTGGQGNSLPKGNPINIAPPNRGFDVKYELTGTFKGFEAPGSARLSIRVNGEKFSADLSARASGAAFTVHSGGSWRKDTIATENFNELMDMPWPFNKSDKQSSFTVNYAQRKVNFTNRGQAYERELTTDPLYDYLGAIAYLQAGFQSGALRSGQGRITLPIGKRQDIGTASIQINATTNGVSTYDGAHESIPVTISVDSTSIKAIHVWFMVDANYEPRKMHIIFGNGEVTLLGRQGS